MDGVIKQFYTPFFLSIFNVTSRDNFSQFFILKKKKILKRFKKYRSIQKIILDHFICLYFLISKAILQFFFFFSNLSLLAKRKILLDTFKYFKIIHGVDETKFQMIEIIPIFHLSIIYICLYVINT